MLADMSVKEFLTKVSSKAPTPGGGSIAALCGALACALSSMVANLTIDNKKYTAVKDDMEGIIEDAKGHIVFFTEQMDADAHAFEGVMQAYRMPKKDDKEKKSRNMAIQQGLKEAAEVPLHVAQRAFDTMDMLERVVERGNVQAVTDGAVGVMLARTAVLAALYNTEINLASIKDDDYRERLQDRVRMLRDETHTKEKHILEKVKL